MKRFFFFVFASLALIMLTLSCAKEVSLEVNKDSVVAAQGSLQDSLGVCMPITVHGTYYNGIPVGDTNFVTVTVNVTTAGTYKITTDEANGIYFYDSGFFSKTGIDTIHLQAIGTPSFPVPIDFAVTFDSTTCAFTVNVQDSTGTGLGGGGGSTDDSSINKSDSAWFFNDSLTSYHGPFDSAYLGVITYGANTAEAVVMKGYDDAADTFLLAVRATGNTVTPGSYSTKTDAFLQLTDGEENLIYAASPLVTQAGLPAETTVIVSSFDASSRVIQGTFSGTVTDTEGRNITISNGKFKAKLLN